VPSGWITDILNGRRGISADTAVRSAAARTYTVLLQPAPEGGYTMICPALPGLVT
jgi:uncharacterized protein